MKPLKLKKLIMPMSVAAITTVGYLGGYQTAKIKTTPIKGDYFTIAPKEFVNIYQSSFRIDRYATLEEKCKGSKVVNHFGSGVLLRDSQTGNEYILTANHMTPYLPGESFLCKEEVEGTKFEKKIKVLESHLTVENFPAVVVKSDTETDQALLKIEGKIDEKLSYNGKIAKQLKVGDYVIGVGFPDGEHPYSIANVESQRKYMTLLNIEIIGGNSGGGFYRFSEKGLELIGTVRGGTAITSLEKMRELIKGTPLEDEYL